VEFKESGEDFLISGDREALGGALWNFLDNAVKYSPDANGSRSPYLAAMEKSKSAFEIMVRESPKKMSNACSESFIEEQTPKRRERKEQESGSRS
jgi:K+-sensing histidine kinase KdpD